MKRNLILLSVATSLLALTSCGGGNNPSVNYHVATFHLNYETENEAYLSLVVNLDAKLEAPTNPTREGFVFANWTIDQENQNVYADFGKTLNKDIDLYASWTPISEVSDATKLGMLVDSLTSVSSGANHAYAKQKQVEYYPQFQESPLSYYQERDITRYKDITIAKYYESDTSKDVLAEQQYQYDNTSFYSLLKDYGNESGSSKVTTAFDATQIDNFLNVDFMNLYGADLKALLKLLNNPNKIRVPYGEDDSSSSTSETEEFVGDYSAEMAFDPSAFSLSKESYSFAVAYETYYKNEQYGWITQSYSTTATISFLNGKINRAIVQMSYSFALSEGPYYISVSSETCSWNYGEYIDYSGTRFNPADFTENTNS